MYMQRRKPLISEMARQDRPREKFELYGGDKLSDAELLAVILRTGSRDMSAVALAEDILSMDIPGTGLEKLYHLSKKDLMAIHGVGQVKAVQIMAI
jgi:DNA repair protein RadC